MTAPLTDGRGAYDRLSESDFDPLPRVVGAPPLSPTWIDDFPAATFPSTAADQQRHDTAPPARVAVPLPPSWTRYVGAYACLALAVAFMVAAVLTDDKWLWVAAAWCVLLAAACLVIARVSPQPSD
jgi:hypothetical protein